MIFILTEFISNHNGYSIPLMHENYYQLIIIFQVILIKSFFVVSYLWIIGSVLPPHLSPFVEEKEGDYVPPERFGQRQPENDIEEQTTKQGRTYISFKLSI